MSTLVPISCFDVFESLMKLDPHGQTFLGDVFGQGNNLEASSKFNLLGMESFNSVDNLKTNAILVGAYFALVAAEQKESQKDRQHRKDKNHRFFQCFCRRRVKNKENSACFFF